MRKPDEKNRIFFENACLVSVITKKHLALLELNINRLQDLGILPARAFIVTTDLSSQSQNELGNFLHKYIDSVEVYELGQEFKNTSASLEHMNALNVAIKACQSNVRFIWIMDPDFFIVTRRGFDKILECLDDKGLVLTPWSPRWFKKKRSVATAHFALIDLLKKPLPIFQNTNRMVMSESLKIRSLKEKSYLFRKVSIVRSSLGGILAKEPRMKFLAKFRTRLSINSVSDTFLNLPLHESGTSCNNFRDCQGEHLVHVVRKGIDVMKPKEFIFGLWWEFFIPSSKSFWPRAKGFQVINETLSDSWESILNNGELLCFKGEPCGWHLRSIGRAGGDPKSVDYNRQWKTASKLIPLLNTIAFQDEEGEHKVFNDMNY